MATFTQASPNLFPTSGSYPYVHKTTWMVQCNLVLSGTGATRFQLELVSTSGAITSLVYIPATPALSGLPLADGVLTIDYDGMTVDYMTGAFTGGPGSTYPVQPYYVVNPHPVNSFPPGLVVNGVMQPGVNIDVNVIGRHTGIAGTGSCQVRITTDTGETAVATITLTIPSVPNPEDARLYLNDSVCIGENPPNTEYRTGVRIGDVQAFRPALRADTNDLAECTLTITSIPAGIDLWAAYPEQHAGNRLSVWGSGGHRSPGAQLDIPWHLSKDPGDPERSIMSYLVQPGDTFYMGGIARGATKTARFTVVNKAVCPDPEGWSIGLSATSPTLLPAYRPVEFSVPVNVVSDVAPAPTLEAWVWDPLRSPFKKGGGFYAVMPGDSMDSDHGVPHNVLPWWNVSVPAWFQTNENETLEQAYARLGLGQYYAIGSKAISEVRWSVDACTIDSNEFQVGHPRTFPFHRPSYLLGIPESNPYQGWYAYGENTPVIWQTNRDIFTEEDETASFELHLSCTTNELWDELDDGTGVYTVIGYTPHEGYPWVIAAWVENEIRIPPGGGGGRPGVFFRNGMGGAIGTGAGVG